MDTTDKAKWGAVALVLVTVAWLAFSSLMAPRAKDNKAWSEAKTVNSLAAYQNYLRDFPAGRHRAEAEEGQASIAKQSSDCRVLMEFLASNPQSKYATETRNRLMVLLEAACPNSGSGGGIRLSDLAAVFLSLTGSEIPVGFEPITTADPSMDVTALKPAALAALSQGVGKFGLHAVEAPVDKAAFVIGANVYVDQSQVYMRSGKHPVCVEFSIALMKSGKKVWNMTWRSHAQLAPEACQGAAGGASAIFQYSPR